MLFSYFEWMRQGEGQQKSHDNSVLLYTKAAILAVFHFQTDKLRLSSIFVLTVHLKPHITEERGLVGKAHYGQNLFPLYVQLYV